MTRGHDPDLLDSIIAERHHARPAPPPTEVDPEEARKAARRARAVKLSAWDPVACILGVIAIARPAIAPEMAKLTGLQPGTVCTTLISMERKRQVRKTGAQAAGWDGQLYDTWERVVKPP